MKVTIKRQIKKNTTTQEIVKTILNDRGIVNEEEYFHPSHPREIPFSDFFEDKTEYKKNLKKTISILQKIHNEKKTIVVYTDYDADGITGGAILWETLHLLGFNVMPYVPDRKTEGYGFSKKGIDAVKKQFDPALIISVDHGIVAHEKISYAKSIGIPIIVTDHHQKINKKNDNVFAIFHTDKLSGSGVAYFFAKEIYHNFQLSINNSQILEKNFLYDYLALAATGIIADLVPLTGYARGVAKHGLTAYATVARPGLCAILHDANITGKTITPYEVGFMIAPRLNAFGRLTHAIDALRLLCTTQEKKANDLAQKAGITNRERQQLVEEAVTQAMEMVDETKKIIILYSQTWEEGIIGLVASKMVEKHYRPTIVITRSDGFSPRRQGYEGQAKASARSIKNFDITSFLRSLKKHLIDVGGHKMAAGFSIKTEKIPAFIEAAEEEAEKILDDEDLIKIINVDAELPLALATLELAQEIEKMQPFGMGNPKPVFMSEGKIIDIKYMGKNKNHLKINLKSEDSFPLEVIFFNNGIADKDISIGKKISIVYSLEINRWNRKEKVNAIGKNMRL